MKERREIELDGVDLLLLAGMAVLLVVTLVLLLPMVWGPVVYVMDVRNWSRWTWIAINAAVVVVLVLIRAWMRRGE